MAPTRRRFLRFSLRAALLALVWLAPAAGQQPARVTLTLLSTTDIHGNIYPIDYLTNLPANRGLAKIATLVKQVRAENPNTLLLDSGDTVQGSSLAYYSARKDLSKPNPTVAAMNAMRYDAMAVGNHDFELGLEVFRRAKGEAKFPWLAANVRQKYKKSSGEYIPPYVVKEIAGVRVAIVGLITPSIPYWLIPENYRGYKFEQIVEAARRVIPEARKQADVVVVLSHSGLDRDAVTGQPFPQEIPGENATWELAEQVPGIDVILFGHTHSEVPEKFINGVLLTQARSWAQSLARADIEMERGADGRWKIAGKKSRILAVTDQVAADPEILELARPYHEATQRYLDTPVGTLGQPLEGRTGRVEDSPLVELIHHAQMEYGKADVSLATMFIPNIRFEAGPITVRQLSALYPYDNTLYAVEMTGAQLKEALEHAASFYPAWPRADGLRFAPPGYQCDSAEGVTYTIDLTRPAGERVREIMFRGKPLDAKRKLRVAINNYRYSGGGGYTVYQKTRAVLRSSQGVRDLLIKYVARTKEIPTTSSHNWEIVPAEAREALIESTQRRAALAASAPARGIFALGPRQRFLHATHPHLLWKNAARDGQNR